jgi:hypothetical protein
LEAESTYLTAGITTLTYRMALGAMENQRLPCLYLPPIGDDLQIYSLRGAGTAIRNQANQRTMIVNKFLVQLKRHH